MDLLSEITINMNSVINILRNIEKPEYKKNITIEKLIRERKDATEMLKSILKRRHEIINSIK